MNKLFIYETLIREHHLDTFGHVNNATYLTLLEEARWEFLHTNGISLGMIHQQQIGPVILECEIKFIKELTLRQVISIHSQISSFENKVGTIQQNIFNNNKELCSTAKITFGLFDMQSRKLILPPSSWLLAMGVSI
jgi:thioesterase-3